MKKRKGPLEIVITGANTDGAEIFMFDPLNCALNTHLFACCILNILHLLTKAPIMHIHKGHMRLMQLTQV